MAKSKRDEVETTEAPGLELNPEIEGELAAHDAPPATPENAATANPVPTPEQLTDDLREEIRNAPKSLNRQTEPPPDCPCCNVPCLSKNSDEFYTRYYCPNKRACPMNFTLKVLRPYARRVLAGRRDQPDEPYAARP